MVLFSTRLFLFVLMLALLAFPVAADETGPAILKADDYRSFIDRFNADDNELYTDQETIPNTQAWDFLQANMPLLDCPDQTIEEIYYFRWWTYRKHLLKVPPGWIVTEFLPKVPWASQFNSINCAVGHHLYEGRWLRDPSYLNDDISFFLRPNAPKPPRYTWWIADAVWQRACVTGDFTQAKAWLPALIADYDSWKNHLATNGLYFQDDDKDAMEVSIGGFGFRAPLNSCQYGNAIAIAQIADMAGQPDIATDFRARAAKLKQLVQDNLWDANDQFFKVSALPLKGDPNAVVPPLALIKARELHGYTPWYFHLPDADKSSAWKQVMDPQGFLAPYGLTTAEQRDPKFVISYTGHECQWNGPVWPFATSITLTAMANLLDDYEQNAVSAKDYFQLLQTYAKSQHRTLDDGRVVPWIDEDQDPFTGQWIARAMLIAAGKAADAAGKKHPPSVIMERGKDYNHSTFCDLIINGLIGVRPRADDMVDVRPLVPDTWDYFCLDAVPYHGHLLTIFYDKTGQHYHRGTGLSVLSDGKPIATSPTLSHVTGKL